MLVELALQSSTDCIGCWENLLHFKGSGGAIGGIGKLELANCKLIFTGLRVILEVILTTCAVHKID